MAPKKERILLILKIGFGQTFLAPHILHPEQQTQSQLHGCASWKAAVEAGKPVIIEADQTLALCVAKVGANSFQTARHLVDKNISRETYLVAPQE